jgi:putative heme-binding domain-containing protein
MTLAAAGTRTPRHAVLAALIISIACAGRAMLGAAEQPMVLFLIGEPEYQTATTLPEFAASELVARGLRCAYATEDPKDPDDFVGLEALPGADLLVISVRRHAPSAAHLALVRAHLAAGKPVVGIRTASHAFAAKPRDEAHAAWPAFDQEVLGGSYGGHYDDLPARLTSAGAAAGHPILLGVDAAALSTRKLYRNPTLAPGATALLDGISQGESTLQHVAWVNQAGASRVFYTSLGTPGDFALPAFRRLLANAVFWALGRTPPLGRADPAPPSGAPPDATAAAGRTLSPAQALAAMHPADGLVVELLAAEPLIAKPVFMNFDERGRMWVVQYRQYPHPAGLQRISHDEFWRSIYDRTSPPPPHQFTGADRISVCTGGGSGILVQVEDVISGLNLATAVERGRGSLWVLSPPYLLRYPLDPAGDRIAGEPEVALSGFNFEDTHAVANSLRWGPDGWLYGAVGSTVTTEIVRPGLDRTPLLRFTGQGVWRYHPESRRFEMFSEGGGNTFGVEIDDQGRIFSGHNGGDTRGFAYLQGAYEMKGFEKHGPLSNPYAFGFFPPMPSSNPIPRFSHTLVIYGGGALPGHDGRLLAIDPLHGRLIESAISRERTAFRTADLAPLLTSDDPCFRPVDIKVGPDGALYLCDWHDQQINHFRNSEGRIDHGLGRIYRLGSAAAVPLPAFDLARLTSTQLVEQLHSANRWFRQTALRVLGDRRDAAIIPALRMLLDHAHGQFALEALWALNLSGGFDDAATLAALAHPEPQVRAWAVRLRGDDGRLPPAIAARLRDLAVGEVEAEVRAQLACTSKRLPAADGLPIVAALMRHDEDADDPRLPLLVWWAIEAKAGSDAEAVLALFDDPASWARPLVQRQLLGRLMHRYAAAGTRHDLLLCARLLGKAPSGDDAARLLAGFDEAFGGRPLNGLPDELLQALASHGGGSTLLRLRRGDAQAPAEVLRLVADAHAPLATRIAYLGALGEVETAGAVQALLAVLEESHDARLETPALNALARYDDAQVPPRLIAIYNGLSGEGRRSCQAVLSSRTPWAKRLVAAVREGAIPIISVDMAIVRRLAQSGDAALSSLVREQWGKLGAASSAEMEREIARIKGVLEAGSGDPARGFALFQASCSCCHTLFGHGGQIGPDLTSARRDDLDSLLLSIVNPSAEIREGYATCTISTKDGRSLVGFVADQDEQVVGLRGLDGHVATIERAQISSLALSGASLMPEGLLNGLADQQLRDFFAYVRSSQPLPGKH